MRFDMGKASWAGKDKFAVTGQLHSFSKQSPRASMRTIANHLSASTRRRRRLGRRRHEERLEPAVPVRKVIFCPISAVLQCTPWCGQISDRESDYLDRAFKEKAHGQAAQLLCRVQAPGRAGVPGREGRYQGIRPTTRGSTGQLYEWTCSRKKRSISFVASGPLGSVKDPAGLPPDHA